MLLAGYQARSFFEINRQIEGSDGKSGVDLFFRTDGFFGPFLINVQETLSYGWYTLPFHRIGLGSGALKLHVCRQSHFYVQLLDRERGL